MPDNSDYSDPPPELLDIRRSIDNIDVALIHILAERFKFTDRAGRVKADNDLAVSDQKREINQVIALRKLAVQSGLDADIAEKIINLIVAEVLCRHSKLRK